MPVESSCFTRRALEVRKDVLWDDRFERALEWLAVRLVLVVGLDGFPRRLACASMTFRSSSSSTIDRRFSAVVARLAVVFATS